MSLSIIGEAAGEVVDIWGKTLAESGQDNYRKNVLDKYIPQVFAQDLNELREEIQSMSKGVKKGEKGSFTSSGESLDVPAIITLEESKCVEIYLKIFETEKNFQKSNVFNGKNIGTDGIVLDKVLWNALVSEALSLLKTGDWVIAPVRNQKAAQTKINSEYSKKIAAAEMKNRKGTSRASKEGREEIEETYVQYRMSGYQSSRIKHGSKERYRPEGLTDWEKSTGLQLGHADEGAPTWQHKISHAEKIVKSAKASKGKRALLTKIGKIKEEFSCEYNHKEHIDLNGMQKGYSFILITGQRTKLNQKQQAAGEAKLGSAAHNACSELLLKPHHTKLTDTIGGLLLHKLTKGNKGVLNTSKKYLAVRKVKSNEKKKTPKKTVNRKYTVNVGQGGLSFAVLAKKARADNKKSRRQTNAAPLPSSNTIGSPLQLLAIFNANLEQAIIENMGGQALNNRTGRFAGSVKVLNITPVRGTTGAIQYTYQRNPYQVFEGDAGRDPRLLIDNTLREQAAEMALGKFTTQRV